MYNRKVKNDKCIDDGSRRWGCNIIPLSFPQLNSKLLSIKLRDRYSWIRSLVGSQQTSYKVGMRELIIQLRIIPQNKTRVVYGHSSSRIWGGAVRRSNRKWPEVTWPEVTRSHVTGRGHDRKCVLRILNRYYKKNPETSTGEKNTGKK
jgi:hypothetical protein